MNLQEQTLAYLSQAKILKKDFAKEIGISHIKLSHWFSGNVILDKVTIERIKAIIN